MHDFALEYDTETNIAFIRKVKDELRKNHTDMDINVTSGFMTQVLDANGRPHKMCPVRSFEKYINHLNPKCTSVWQQPQKNIKLEDAVWYISRALDHSPLDTYVSSL